MIDKTIRDVWYSAFRLRHIFGVKPTKIQAYVKVCDELDELWNAETPEEAVREAADVLVTVLNMAFACGATLEDVERGIHAVIIKNNAKNNHNHYVEDGIIRRKRGFSYHEPSQSFIYRKENEDE